VFNAPSKPVSFSRPKVGYFSNRPRMCYFVLFARFAKKEHLVDLGVDGSE